MGSLLTARYQLNGEYECEGVVTFLTAYSVPLCVQTSGLISHFTDEISALWVPSGQPLRCYECEEEFDDYWTPYTICQANVSAVPIATCLETDKYCMVRKLY